MAGNPFDQFDAPTSVAPAAGGNPFDQFDKSAKAAPAQRSAYQPTWLDKVTNVANPTLGLGDVLASGVGQGIAALGGPNRMPTVAQARAQRSQEASELGPAVSIPASIAGYGPMGAVLGPSGATAGLAGRPIAQGVAEGALAGGISDFDPNNPVGSVAHGAMAGGALGGVAGGLTHGANWMLSKPGVIDPAQVAAQTTQKSSDIYARGKQIPIAPADMGMAISQPMANLDPSVQTGLSSGFKSQYNDIRQALIDQHNQGNSIDANMVDSWQRQINQAATSPADGVAAAQIRDNLDQLLKDNGAGQWQQDARTAYARSKNAEALQQLQQQLEDFGQGPGGVPQQQAETYYKPGDPEYQGWASIAQAGKKGMDPSYVAGHWGADIGESLGAATMGFPGYVIGKGAGYLGGKMLGKKAVANWQNSALLKAYQAQYPTLTGIRTPPPQPANPMVGDLIKNLMIGAAY